MQRQGREHDIPADCDDWPHNVNELYRSHLGIQQLPIQAPVPGHRMRRGILRHLTQAASDLSNQFGDTPFRSDTGLSSPPMPQPDGAKRIDHVDVFLAAFPHLVFF
ncbi:hypothetical protein D1872_310980 [compost metagenome]